MLARRIDRNGGNDNYRALALYIADARRGRLQGEKTLHSWYAGGQAENYLEGLVEVEAAQSLNTRTGEAKTYHLMVSFRPEDEAKLTPKVIEDIEVLLAETLGFGEHQRHCGVHRNTDNLHLHISYNKVHPEKFTCHTPYYDFSKLSRVCRVIEQKYGLAADRGMDQDRLKQDSPASARVKSIEAQTGQESFFSYVLRHKPGIMAEIEKASGWREVHETFLRRGMRLAPCGNGFIIKDQFGKHRVKPSDVDRSLSKRSLTDRFGTFVEPDAALIQSVAVMERYSAKPLQREPERNNLFAMFQEEMKQRRESLEALKQESARRYAAVREHWRRKRSAFERLPMLRRDRQRVSLELKKREQAEIEDMRTELAEKRNQVRREIPYTSWSKCLQHKAALGDETALAILRSKKEVIQPEQAPPYIQAPTSIKPAEKWREKQRDILDAPGVAPGHRRALLAAAKMRELLEREAGPAQPALACTHSIDTKGTVIFKLASGGVIRDSGLEIHFSAHDERLKELAAKYAALRWGPEAVIENNIIKRPGLDRRPPRVNTPDRHQSSPER